MHIAIVRPISDEHGHTSSPSSPPGPIFVLCHHLHQGLMAYIALFLWGGGGVVSFGWPPCFLQLRKKHRFLIMDSIWLVQG